MALDPAKLKKALKRASKVKGVSVPASLDMGLEQVLVKRQVMLWEKALDAVLKILPKTGADGAPHLKLVVDVSQVDIAKVIDSVFRKYGDIEQVHKDIEGSLKRGDTFHRKAFLKTIKAAMGVGVADLLNDKRAAKVVATRLKQSVGLIVKLDKEMKARLHRDIAAALAQDLSTLNIKKLVLENTSLPNYRARLIARDQMGKLFSQLSMTRQEDLGVTEYTWRTVGDNAVRQLHQDRDGKKFSWDKPPSDGHPGMAVNCRCIAEPVLATANLEANPVFRKLEYKQKKARKKAA